MLSVEILLYSMFLIWQRDVNKDMADFFDHGIWDTCMELPSELLFWCKNQEVHCETK